VRLSIALGIACLVGLVLGAVLMQRLRVRRDSRLGRARQARGKRAELHAETLLREAGYAIVARQRRSAYRLRADTLEVPVGLAVDFVVSRNGRELVAEVKTGAAASLAHADTRRQLLEYQLASGARGVLLVDPERDRITEVSFPFAALSVADAAASSDDPQASPRAFATRGSAVFVTVVALGTLGLLVWLALHAHAFGDPR
jgi:hypothetical protein